MRTALPMDCGAAGDGRIMTEELGIGDALKTIERAVRFERSLRSRTEGLTWIVWGIVCAATFLTFEATSPLFYGDGPFAQDVAPHDQRSPWWAQALWVPWLLVGVATTYAVWRSAALSSANVPLQSPKHWGILFAWVGFVALGWAIAVLLFREANPSTYPVLGIGTAWVLFGVTNVYRGTLRGRRVMIAIGCAVFLAGVLMAATLGPHSESPSGALAGHLGALVTGVVPIAGGLWQTLRG